VTAERLARRNAEDALAEAVEARQEAERHLRGANAARTVHAPSKPSMARRAAVGQLGAASDNGDAPNSVVELHPGDAPANTRMVEAPTIVRRHGRDDPGASA
jgi:hypothetical protein